MTFLYGRINQHRVEQVKVLLRNAKSAGKLHGFAIHDMYLNIIARNYILPWQRCSQPPTAG